MPQIDPLLSLAFAMHANRGTQAVLLGSGVSRAAGIYPHRLAGGVGPLHQAG